MWECFVFGCWCFVWGVRQHDKTGFVRAYFQCSVVKTTCICKQLLVRVLLVTSRVLHVAIAPTCLRRPRESLREWPAL